MPLEEWNWTIGEIVAPFGRMGEVKVRLETDFPDRFARLKQVCLRSSQGFARLVDIESVRLHKGQALLKLRGVSSINEAETLRNTLVQVRGQDAVRLPSHEFYIHEMLGAEVVTTGGVPLGSLTTILRSPANDVLVIGAGRDEILLPVIKDVIRELDVANRRIVVTPTPGLLPGESEDV
jgi:16S rRNA processing protein RimM